MDAYLSCGKQLHEMNKAARQQLEDDEVSSYNTLASFHEGQFPIKHNKLK